MSVDTKWNEMHFRDIGHEYAVLKFKNYALKIYLQTLFEPKNTNIREAKVCDCVRLLPIPTQTAWKITKIWKKMFGVK